MASLSHFDDAGAARMVAVGDKPITARSARASARVRMNAATWRLIRDRTLSKGDVLAAARLAGIMAAKQTPNLIPLCHVLPLESVTIDYQLPQEESIPEPVTPQPSNLLIAAGNESTVVLTIQAVVQITARTGVEMEALTAAAVTALTIYDMCKSVDRGLVIEAIQLEEKSGGRSGHYVRE